MEIKCPECGRKYDIDHREAGKQMECPACGNFFKVTNMKLAPCPDCFSLISKRAVTCPKCGAPLASEFDHDRISQETDLEVFHPSPLNYLWIIILGLVTLPLVVGLFILIFVLIEIKFTSYKLTTHRIIVCRGMISKFQNEIWIKDMRGVDLKQGIWQRLLGIGNIYIGTAASIETEISIIGISRPSEVVAKINSLR